MHLKRECGTVTTAKPNVLATRRIGRGNDVEVVLAPLSLLPQVGQNLVEDVLEYVLVRHLYHHLFRFFAFLSCISHTGFRFLYFSWCIGIKYNNEFGS